ncbi:MAG TPA: hypothetical protein VE225_02130, partial [Rubrobacteraceae bacterium]|nr:hypothetical protein [Rubrobacteraceae bacterium]
MLLPRKKFRQRIPGFGPPSPRATGEGGEVHEPAEYPQTKAVEDVVRIIRPRAFATKRPFVFFHTPSPYTAKIWQGSSPASSDQPRIRP